MRVVLKAKRAIPGFAQEGDHIVLRLTDLKHPVSVTVEHSGAEAWAILHEYADRLEIVSEAPTALSMLVLQEVQKANSSAGGHLELMP